MKQTPQLAGSVSYQKRCDQCTFADALQPMCKKEGKQDGSDRHSDITCNFRKAEIRCPGDTDCTDQRFSGQHGHVCQNLQIDAGAENDAADQKVDHGREIVCRRNEKEQEHGQIDKISEYDGYGYLQNMLQLKIFTKDQQLQQDQKKAEQDGKLSQRQRKIQA